MANSKISALTSATTPLAGTEVLPIVQSSTTKQVSVANLTVGRSVSMSDATASTGNFTLGTANKGVNFTANSSLAGMTSQLLSWYEEGTTTPTVSCTSGALTSYTVSAVYTRVGRLVTFTANVTITNAGTGAGALTIALPYTAGGYAFNGSGRENALTGYMLQAYIAATGTVVNVVKYDNTTAIATNAQCRMTITYSV